MPDRETPSALALEEQESVQRVLTQYHQISDLLHTGVEREQAEAAISVITSLSQAAQFALLKSLVAERSQDAADLLAAINELSPAKEVRKEARRALLRLQNAKITPQWHAPAAPPLVASVAVTTEPRFWKGFVTQTREQGEVQVVLCWEHGYEYGEGRLISMLLDFWEAGVKDAFTDTGSRRHINRRIEDLQMHMASSGHTLVDCTLAEGKRLLEDALTVNTWKKVAPGGDYRSILSLINKLILQVQDPGQDRGRTFIPPDMEDQEVVVNFLGAWTFGDYALAHDLLSPQSDALDNLSRTEWIEQRLKWYGEAHPARMELSFVRERPARQSAIWLPGGPRSTPNQKEIEVGWSVELVDTPVSGTLKEMPMGTTVNKETGRHWFWTAYTLVRQEEGWRIQKITDEGVALQGLSIEEIQARIKEYNEVLDRQIESPDDPAVAQALLDELSWRIPQLLHLYDALLVKLPLDAALHEEAYSVSLLLGNAERSIVYLERLVQRFPQNRADNLTRLGSTYASLAFKYQQRQGLSERVPHLLELAEKNLREAIGLINTALGHILLGELLANRERYDEAETEFQQAQMLQPTRDEEANIEAGFANIAMSCERMAEAIPHFTRVLEINPAYPGAWFSRGFARRLLNNLEEAEQDYLHGLETEPDDPRLYSELTALYSKRDEYPKAKELLEKALQTQPPSAYLHALLSSVLLEMGDRRGARREIEKAEEIDPASEMVQKVKGYITSSKK